MLDGAPTTAIERVMARLEALSRDLAADNRFRLGLLGQSASRAYVLDWAGGARNAARIR